MSSRKDLCHLIHFHSVCCANSYRPAREEARAKLIHVIDADTVEELDEVDVDAAKKVDAFGSYQVFRIRIVES